MTKNIAGAGGGGGGKGGGGGGSARVAQEAADSLRSKSYASIIDLLGEGEMQGPATGDILTSMYLDKTVVKNADGSTNFTGITIASRNGTQSQSYIPGFPNSESEVAVGTEVKYGAPIVRTITDSTYTSARVTVSVPQLSQQNTTNGDINGTSVSISIQVSANGGPYVTKILDDISGKTTTKYQRSYLIQLTGSAPWSIRVNRTTEDSTVVSLQNKTFFESYTQIVDGKLRYPNSAIVASVIDSQQFSSIPVRGYDWKLLRTQIPSNATVRADGSLTYSGSWNGTFQIAWHANPAWAFYDMLTTDRYGLGTYIDAAQVDKWALYTIGQYCDVLVDNGFGGVEPRFTCNLYMQTRAEAFKVLQDMASVFRGLAYWSSGLITPVQDAPSDPVALYSNSNVVDGLFTYSGSSLKTRHSVALVTWNDPSDFYQQKVEYVEDAAAIARYGIVSTDIIATGCTSRGQAHRVGKWLLYSEANETETVSFKTGLDGVLVRPGQVINVQDTDRAGVRYSGRLLSASPTSLTIDAPIVPSIGEVLTAVVMLQDGTTGSARVSSVVGSTLNLATALPSAPASGAIWMLNSNKVALQTFRVVSVSEAGDGTYEISGLVYNPSKYNSVETGNVLTQNPVSTLNTPPDAPSAVTITESLYETNTDIAVLVLVSWQAVPRATSYTATYKRDDGQTVIVQAITGTILEIRDAQPGSYLVTVAAVNSIGKRSVASTATQQIYGKTSPPSDVTNFSLQAVTNGVASLTWDQSPDLDVRVGGSIRIRYSTATSGATWGSSVDIGPALPGSATGAAVPMVTGTYLAKFIDSTDHSSVNAATVAGNIANVANLNVVQTITESPTFAGSMTNVIYSVLRGGIVLQGSALLSTFPLLSSVLLMSAQGGIAASGEYAFQNTADLGGVYTSQLTAYLSATGYDVLDSIAARTANISTWRNIVGSTIDDVNALLYVRVTNDDPAGTPTWSSWQPFFVGQYTSRAFQFKLILTSEFATHNIAITGLSVTIDMPDRTEAGNNIASGAAPYAVTYPSGFWASPSVGIAAHNMATGDYYTLTSKTALGFIITFYNSAGTVISRTFDYLAKGQGRKS